MPFVTDTFTDTDDVGLTSHTGELGATWVTHAGNDAGSVPKITSNQLVRTTPDNHILYASGTPASADYTVSLDWVSGGGATILGPGGRMSTAANTGYFAFFFSGAINIYKYVAGSLSVVPGASSSWSPASGQTYRITLDMVGTALKARVQRLGDSQWLTSSNTYQAGQTDAINTTDSSITAAGKAGFWLSAAATEKIDNFSADDAAVGLTATGSFTLDDFVFSGTLATGALSQLSSGFTLDDLVMGGFLGLAPGRIDTNPFKNWTGTLLPGVTVPNVVFLKLDRTLALALADQVTAGDAVMTITNASLVTGTYYVMVSYNADGSALGAELVLAT